MNTKALGRRWLRWAAGCAAALLGLAGAPAVQAAPANTACPPQPAPLSADDQRQGLKDAVDRGFLWRARKDGRDSWLYGTLHVARKPWAFPGPQVRSALQASDKLALELDMMDPELLRRLAMVMVASPNQRPLPGELQRRLRDQSAAACVGGELAALRPEMQAVTLTVMIGRRAGLEAAYGIDMFLAGYARQLNKPVMSLETPEAQIGMLLQATPEDTEKFVDRALSDLENGLALPTLNRLAEAWARADWNELSHYADWCRCLETEADRALMRRLIDERNQAMVRQFQARHAAGEKLFVAVGALHMIGPEGLPALLAAQGFEVQRIEPGR